MIRVYFDTNAIYIDGYRTALVAGTLSATMSGDTITISTVGSSEPLAAGLFSVFARQDGSGFADAPTCLAYLATQFAMRRPLAFEFTQVDPAPSWAIAHGLGFRPNVFLLDTTGEEILGVVSYPDVNTVAVSFGAPTSGTAYLS